MAACSQVVISSQAVDIEERFAHLLNPIRDLARNWEINLSHDLELYLKEMVCHSETTSINFAQAALVIQGSTCVYSKKVEYLHGLVYRSFEEICSKRKKALPTSLSPSGKDKDTTFENHAEEFLSLDDLEVSAAINNRNRRVSLPRTTAEEHLYIVPSETAASSADKNDGDAANRHDFLLNTSGVHTSGAYLLTPRNSSLIGGRRGHELPQASFPHQNVQNPGEVLVDVAPCSAVDDDDFAADAAVSDGEDPVPHPPPRRDNAHLRQIPTKRVEAKTIDKVKLLDPYVVSTNDKGVEQNGRVLRKRVLIKMPASLKASRVKRRRAGDAVVNVKKEPISPLAKFCPFKNFSHVPHFPKNMGLIPNFAALEDLYWTELKRRKELLQARQKLLAELEKEGDQIKDGLDDNLEMDDNVDDIGGCPDDDDGDVGREERTAIGHDQIFPVDKPVASTYEDLVKNYVQDVGRYCQENGMGNRVNEWADRIKPKLAAEEQREPYDIHRYGTLILDCYGDNNRKQTLHFASIVHGLDRTEVSRYFLAALQLANTENVQISTQGVLEEGMDTMELTLLSRKRHHEELQDFRSSS